MLLNVFSSIIVFFQLDSFSCCKSSKCSQFGGMPKNGDFLVGGKFLFEVDGKSKTFDQIKDLFDSYLAISDIEFGNKNCIPLWMFGLLY